MGAAVSSVRHRPALAIMVVVALVTGWAALKADRGTGDSSPAGSVVQPVLSVASSFGRDGNSDSAWLIGAAPDGEPGEAWAMVNLPYSAGPPGSGSARLAYGETSNQDGQTVLLRHTDATGWHAYETPLKANGDVERLITVARATARVTAHGGGAFIAKSGASINVYKRDPRPGGRYRAVELLSGTLLPADADGPAETFASGTLSRSALATYEDGDTTAFFVAAVGRDAETVVHFDGSTWSREPIEYPTGAETDFEVIAIEATAADNAWLLGRAPGRGLMLFERVADDGPVRWEERTLGAPVFEQRESPADGISDLESTFGSGAQMGVTPITVTDDAVWLDGRFAAAGERWSFTLYYDIDAGRVTHSWCDAPHPAGGLVCDSQLGFDFANGTSSLDGYRSQAWAGPGFGDRVISNPFVQGGKGSTNRGTWIRLQQDRFVRMPGAGFENRVSLAMTSPQRGWNGTNVHIGATPFAPTLTQWSIGVRTPLTDVVAEPGGSPDSLQAGALAVGEFGSVARYRPGEGWITEYLQSANGLVQRPTLRGVAWPSAGRAYAVGDGGAMWLWRRESGLWERDPGAPIGLVTNLMGIAFDPANPNRGYAVGREGTLLEYGKAWRRVCARGDGSADCATGRIDDELMTHLSQSDIRQVAFSGGQAIAVSDKKVLVSDGGDWHIDTQAQALVDKRIKATSGGSPRDGTRLLTVSGLPDGAAFAAGTGGLAIKRESRGAPWRYVDQPLADGAIFESAMFRENGAARALISLSPGAKFPPPEPIETPEEGTPPPLLDPLQFPADGYLLRETAYGWDDEQRNAFNSPESVDDKPYKADPVLGIAAGPSGAAWAVGGWNGHLDASDRGSPDSRQRSSVKTAAVLRYRRGPAETAAGNAFESGVPLAQQGVNFVVGGHASCESAVCAEQVNTGLGPEGQLQSALAKAEAMSRQPNGARFFAYTGGRGPASGQLDAREHSRLAALLGSRPELPVFPAMSRGGSPGLFDDAFAGFPTPVGGAPAAAGIVPRGGGSGVRRYYAFESRGATGRLRVVVIDNAAGLLGAEQTGWLRDELRAAKADAVPAIVIGSRDLNHRFYPDLSQRANDALDTARLLRDEGASAYFFDRPEEHRSYPIPAGETDTIPSFGTGALGYRSEIADPGAGNLPSSFFGETGYLVANVDASARDAATNRAPVTVRLIPLIDNLSLEAIDGTEIRRSRQALFGALGRRPLGGDRWNPAVDSSSPAGSDPYVRLPTDFCRLSGCGTRIEPEFEFRSSDPDIADFVKVDPAGNNPRKPLLDANAKTITDNRSGLLCAFNEGETTISATVGGLTYSRRVKVLAGSVRPPCGTRPLSAGRFTTKNPSTATPPPPPPASPAPNIALALPAASAPPVPAPKPPAPQPFDPFVAKLEPAVALTAIAPPPPPTLARPIPPTGGMARVFEEKREEEVATEDSQAYVRFEPSQGPSIGPSLAGLVLIAALAGVALPRRRSGSGGRPVPAFARAQVRNPNYRRSR